MEKENFVLVMLLLFFKFVISGSLTIYTETRPSKKMVSM